MGKRQAGDAGAESHTEITPKVRPVRSYSPANQQKDPEGDLGERNIYNIIALYFHYDIQVCKRISGGVNSPLTYLGGVIVVQESRISSQNKFPHLPVFPLVSLQNGRINVTTGTHSLQRPFSCRLFGQH